MQTAIRGGAVTFQIVVANYSDQIINNILLHDVLPSQLVRAQDYEKLANPASGSAAEPVREVECDIPSLMPGETKTLALETRAIQAGRLTNHVTATAAGGGKADSEASVLVAERAEPLTMPVLAVRLDALQAGEQLVGQELDFRLEVSNPGSAPANNVRVTQSLPDGVEFIYASTAAIPDMARSQVCWTLGNLPAGQTQMLTIKLRAKAVNDWIFKTSATADGAPEAKATHTLHLEGTPVLWLEVVNHEEAIDLGAESVYEVRVLNQGTTAVPGVRLSASVAEGLLVLNADRPTTVVSQASQPRTIVFQPLPQLPGHSDAVYHIRVKGQTVGQWSLMVQTTADQLPKPLVQQVSTQVIER